MKKLLSIVLSIVMMVGVLSAVPVSAAPGDVTFFGDGSFAVDVLRWPNDPIDDNFIDTQYYINVGGVIYTYRDEVDYGTGNVSIHSVRPDKDTTSLTFVSEVPDYAEGGMLKVRGAGIDDPTYLSNIKEIVVEDGITSIYNINNCKSLEKIYIGKDVEYISDCFYDCENLKEIIIDEENKHLLMENDEIYRISENKKELICALNPEENYVVKDDVTGVGNPFGDNEKLKSVVINNNLDYFYINGSESIEEIIIGEKVEKIKSFSIPFFTKIKELDFSKIKVNYLSLDGCKNLEKIVLPENIKKISRGAFEGCKKLNNVVIPDTVTQLKEDAFRGCKSLTNITLSKNLKYIGRNAFYGSGLEEITIPATVNRIYRDAFKFTNIKKVTFEHKEKAPIIKKAIFPTKNKITVNVYSENKKIAKKLKARLKNRVYKANIYSDGKLIYKIKK